MGGGVILTIYIKITNVIMQNSTGILRDKTIEKNYIQNIPNENYPSLKKLKPQSNLFRNFGHQNNLQPSLSPRNPKNLRKLLI